MRWLRAPVRGLPVGYHEVQNVAYVRVVVLRIVVATGLHSPREGFALRRGRRVDDGLESLRQSCIWIRLLVVMRA